MNFSTFQSRILEIGLLLYAQGVDRPSWRDYIMWQAEWHQKWALALKGGYDA